MRTVTHYVGDTQPVFEDVLRTLDQAQTPVDLHDPDVDHVQLFIRKSNGVMKVNDAAQIVPTNDPDYQQGLIRYPWHTTDVDTGDLMTGWSVIHFSDSSTLTQPPFLIDFIPPGTSPGLGCGQWINGDDLALAECAPVTSDVSVLDTAALMASQLLFQWSGGRYPGKCARTIRPISARCQHWAGQAWSWLPAGYPVYSGWGPLGMYEGWGCAGTPQLDLYGMVRRVLSVTVDGSVLDPSLYVLQGGRYLLRTDNANWQGCQDIDRPLDQRGTFAITYEWGVDPPALGVQAAIQLGCELAKLMLGADNCKLPVGVTNVLRQGTTWSLQRDAQRSVLPAARGIDLVDLFLRSTPRRGLQPPIVVNPQAIQHRRV